MSSVPLRALCAKTQPGFDLTTGYLKREFPGAMYPVARDCRCEVHRRERGPVNLGVGEAARDTRVARQESACELDSMKVAR
jgi:hypothetical protein